MHFLIGISSPIVKNKKVIGFHDPCFGNRKFPIDMAGFAINLNYLKEKPNASMPFLKFFEESMFLESLDLQFEEIGKNVQTIAKLIIHFIYDHHTSNLEPLANECTEVLVWHSKTVMEETPQIKPYIPYYADTNLGKLLDDLINKGMIAINMDSGVVPKICLNGDQKCQC